MLEQTITNLHVPLLANPFLVNTDIIKSHIKEAKPKKPSSNLKENVRQMFKHFLISFEQLWYIH